VEISSKGNSCPFGAIAELIMSDPEETNKLLEMLSSSDLGNRLFGIEILGEVGDERVLHALRERMNDVAKEHQALVIAIGKLKRKLGIK
jgi:hypothetical protein